MAGPEASATLAWLDHEDFAAVGELHASLCAIWHRACKCRFSDLVVCMGGRFVVGTASLSLVNGSDAVIAD